MAIEFEVEDGTGKSDSTSYASVTQFDQYWENRGVTYTESDDVKETWLNLATEYLEGKYNFLGTYVTEDQALSWPRSGTVNKNGEVILSDTIPTEIVNAVCYLAAKTTMLDEIESGIKSESYGPVSKTYTGKGISFPKIDNMIKFLLTASVQVVRVN